MHVRTRALVAVVTAVVLFAGVVPTGNAAPTAAKAPAIAAHSHQEVHAIWAHPVDAGTTVESVKAFVERARRAHIDRIIMLVKHMHGAIYWKSRKFAAAVDPDYRNFDLVENLVREAHAVGIKVDAWLVDFPEGVNGAAYKAHPEWAAINPDGETTNSEKLGMKGAPYPYVWMCPSRRPGYVDQWLLPMIEELVRNYQIDGIHNDYVRYAGDIAPDHYCFCDYCIKNMVREAMLTYAKAPKERRRVKIMQPRLEANWWTDPEILPVGWDKMDRREKADFFLNGRSVPDGPQDLRYVFYNYRTRQIDRWVREAYALVKRINPKVEVSASVFKNPVLSGRYIGQQWDRWAPWMDHFTPMTYRSHFTGPFQDWLDQLTETTARQLEWIGRQRPIHQGIATKYLYREERKPLEDLRDLSADLRELWLKGDGPADHPTFPTGILLKYGEKAAAVKKAHDVARKALARFNLRGTHAEGLDTLVAAVTKEKADVNRAAQLSELVKKTTALVLEPPKGFLPPAKLKQSIEAARKAKPDGIVIFYAGDLTRENLWPVLEEAFKPSASAKK
ncbi:MAG: family 10 glycosylhydrolase [Kofleriaceae bacterium]